MMTAEQLEGPEPEEAIYSKKIMGGKIKTREVSQIKGDDGINQSRVSWIWIWQKECSNDGWDI